MDFPYMTMEHSQEAQDIKVMVQIMQLGIWSDGFGPRQSTGLTPRQAEAAVLERMGKLLNEDPTLSSTDTCPQKTLISMRLEIIAFLGALVQTSRGLEAVAEHPSLLCRLVCRISDEVDEMYRFRGGVSLRYVFSGWICENGLTFAVFPSSMVLSVSSTASLCSDLWIWPRSYLGFQVQRTNT